MRLLCGEAQRSRDNKRMKAQPDARPRYGGERSRRHNGGAHLPAPGLQNHHPEQAHERLQKSRDTRSAEGAGQVQ